MKDVFQYADCAGPLKIIEGNDVVKRIGVFTILVILITFINGCATVPLATKDLDAKAKKFTPKPDRSIIYVYRNEIFGGAILMTVAFDGKIVGRTGPKTYFMWEVPPGNHRISSHTENVAELKLKTEAGKVYYVWQAVQMGMWMARSNLTLVDEATGKKGVQDCKLITIIRSRKATETDLEDLKDLLPPR
jgi:hypothetical protein